MTALLLFLAASLAAEPPEQTATVKVTRRTFAELVERLGHDDPAIRQAASAGLEEPYWAETLAKQVKGRPVASADPEVDARLQAALAHHERKARFKELEKTLCAGWQEQPKPEDAPAVEPWACAYTLRRHHEASSEYLLLLEPDATAWTPEVKWEYERELESLLLMNGPKVALDGPTARAIAALAKDGDESVRLRAFRIQALMEPGKQAEILGGASRADASPAVRGRCLQQLWWKDSEAALPYMMSAFGQDPVSDDWTSAYSILRQYGWSQVAPVATALLARNSKNELLAGVALINGFRRVSEEEGTLRALLSCRDGFVRQAAHEVLTRAGLDAGPKPLPDPPAPARSTTD